MSSFELQLYKNGSWTIDSYYDDRDLAVSEAERLDVTGRHAGVRVLKEEYHEPTNTSNYQVIYSRMKKDAVKKPASSSPGRTASRPATDSGRSGPVRSAQRSPQKEPSKGGGVAIPVLGAVLVLIIGLGAMLALQSDMDIGATLDTLVGSKEK